MYPSEYKRHFFMALCSRNVLVLPFYVCGIAFTLISIVISIINRGFSGWLFLCGVIMIAAGVFADLVVRYVMKKTVFPVRTENRIERAELLKRAETELPWLDPSLQAEVNGNWIDLVWDTGDSSARTASFKLLEVGDDYTYRELEMIRTCHLDVNGTDIHYGKMVSIGHFRNESIRHDIASNETEIQKGTGDIVYKWLADHGYTFRP